MHCIRRAASRADCTAGSNSAINTAMIAITTKSSIKVKPAYREAGRCRPSILLHIYMMIPHTLLERSS